MTWIQILFQKVFIYVYAIIDTALIKYLIVLILFFILSLWVWKLIKKNQASKKKSTKIVKLILIVTEVFLVLFQAWFILVHFQTFRLIGK